MRRHALICLMLGVTLASPIFLPMVQKAVGQFIKYTRLPVITMSPAADRSWCAKLEFEALPYKQSIAFFDVDLFFRRQVALERFDDAECIFGVHDAGANNAKHFCYHDCKYFGIDPDKYINTGLFIWNNRLEAHKEIFRYARKLVKQERDLTKETKQKRVLDWGEQSYINAAIQRLDVPLKLLPCEWNYFFIAEVNNHVEYPRRSGPVNALHAAGYKSPAKKMEAVIAFEKYLQMQVHKTLIPA